MILNFNIQTGLSFSENFKWTDRILFINDRRTLEYCRIEPWELYDLFRKQKPAKSLLRFYNWSDLLSFINYFQPVSSLQSEPCVDDLLSVREAIKLDISLFSMSGNFAVPHYQPNRRKYKDYLNILTPSPTDLTEPALICNPNLTEPLKICTRRPDCRYQTNRSSNFERHSSDICDSNSETQIVCQQQMFGNQQNMLDELIHLNYLPFEAKNYVCRNFAAFDIDEGLNLIIRQLF